MKFIKKDGYFNSRLSLIKSSIKISIRQILRFIYDIGLHGLGLALGLTLCGFEFVLGLFFGCVGIYVIWEEITGKGFDFINAIRGKKNDEDKE